MVAPTSMRAAVVAAAVTMVLRAGGASAQTHSDDLCLGECTGSGANRTCAFRFGLDIFAGETGYYVVEGCEGVQPTLGMVEGVTYTFDQSGATNWFHPLGFAYGPDGVYGLNDELEKVVPAPGGAECNASTPCQHAQYQLNGEDLCDADPCDEEDFGLDQYEGVWFSGGRDDWIDAGNFSADVTITDPATTEFFYFCHIHNQMSGRIKVLDAITGEQKDPNDVIDIPYDYHVISEFDEMCGTHNISAYSDGDEECPEMTFLCSDNLDEFGQCMVAVDCAMHVEMRVSGDLDPTVTFMHQMIAHHRNAVNMAKILLKENPTSLRCGTAYDGRRALQDGDDEDDEQHDFCNDDNDDGGTPVITLLWEIINGQNAQITFMNAWLSDNEQPSHDFCDHDDDNSTTIVLGVVAGLLLLSNLVLVGCLCMRKSSDTTKPEPETKELLEGKNVAESNQGTNQGSNVNIA